MLPVSGRELSQRSRHLNLLEDFHYKLSYSRISISTIDNRIVIVMEMMREPVLLMKIFLPCNERKGIE